MPLTHLLLSTCTPLHTIPYTLYTMPYAIYHVSIINSAKVRRSHVSIINSAKVRRSQSKSSPIGLRDLNSGPPTKWVEEGWAWNACVQVADCRLGRHVSRYSGELQ